MPVCREALVCVLYFIGYRDRSHHNRRLLYALWIVLDKGGFTFWISFDLEEIHSIETLSFERKYLPKQTNKQNIREKKLKERWIITDMGVSELFP